MTLDEDFALTRVRWRRSTRSNEMGGACVEVTALDSMIALRDSKDPGGPELLIAPENWRWLLDNVKSGTYDQ